MLHQGRAGLGQPCVDTLFLLPLSSHSSGLQTVNTGAWSVTTHTIVSTQRETVIETNDICQQHLRRRVLERNTDDDIMMHLECQHVELGVSTCELRVSTRALSVNMSNFAWRQQGVRVSTCGLRMSTFGVIVQLCSVTASTYGVVSTCEVTMST